MLQWHRHSNYEEHMFIHDDAMNALYHNTERLSYDEYDRYADYQWEGC